MDLDRARRLKQDLVAEAAGRAGLRRRTLWREDFPGREVPLVALGIEGRNGDHRLAVRVQRGAPGVERVVEDLVRAAGGEARVRQVGYVVPQVAPFGSRRRAGLPDGPSHELELRTCGSGSADGGSGRRRDEPRAAAGRGYPDGGSAEGGSAEGGSPGGGSPGSPGGGSLDGGSRHHHRPLLSGLSVGGPDGPGATLGLLVEDHLARGTGAPRRGLLTAAHALNGIDLLQPAGQDGGRDPADRVARLVRGYLPGPRARNRVDVAFAELVGEVAGPGGADARALPGLGRLNGVRRHPIHTGMEVFKVGRGSGVTRGRVGAFELDDLVVTYRGSIGDALFDGQLEIVTEEGEPPFSRKGDSGALVVDEALRGVGILFAGNGVDASFAHPLHSVLDQLRVRPS